MPERRTLTFTHLDQIMPEVDRLLGRHATVGNWSLGQICNHLSGAFQSSIEGFGAKAPWLIRATIGRMVKPRLFKTGTMMEGIKVPSKFLPRPGLDDRAEAEALRASIGYYLSHPGPRMMHPFFGRLTPEEWDRYHCIHAAHHLRFAVPS